MLAHCRHALLHSSAVFECLPRRLNIKTYPVMPKQKKKNRQPELSRALNAVRRMVRGLRSAAEAIERELSVSAAQLFVLRELADFPDQSVKDLASVTMTTHSTVSQVVSQLIAKGMVTRTPDPVDGRRAVLRLTRQGVNLVKRAPRVIQADLIEGFAQLRQTERRALANGLEKWLDASGLARVPPRMLFDRPLLAKRGTRGNGRTGVTRE
jgi:DNA-binding MarR family transcriptional regulator